MFQLSLEGSILSEVAVRTFRSKSFLLATHLGRESSFGSRKLPYSPQRSCHLDETRCSGSHRIFLLSSIVSILGVLSKKSNADPELCTGQNTAIAKLAGEVLGGVEGVYRLDIGGNACALGSAYKAVWAVERKTGETFERESSFPCHSCLIRLAF